MRSAEALSPVPVRPGAFAGLLRSREAAFWTVQALGWSAYLLVQLGSVLLAPERPSPQKLAGFVDVLLLAAVAGLVLSTGLRYLYRYRGLRERSPWVVVPIALLAVYLVALAHRYAINWGYVVFMDDTDMLTPWWRMFRGTLFAVYLFGCWSALYFGIYFYESMHRERERVLKATALAQEAQMKMLRYQLNPHFLFNTLNAISTLILDRQNDVANQCVTKLSAFLRHTLDQDPMKKVTLRQELDALDLYLKIEQLRFGARLRLDWQVDEAALGALVPSLLLQPLIENALKYAIAPSERGGTLTVGGRVIGGRLLLHVADDGPGLPDGVSLEGADLRGRGVGLRNTRERLQVLYGDRTRFGAVNTRPGLRIDIEMPAEYAS
jgi:signal transduction histidine kinase